jgi:hypothetical protein
MTLARVLSGLSLSSVKKTDAIDSPQMRLIGI